MRFRWIVSEVTENYERCSIQENNSCGNALRINEKQKFNIIKLIYVLGQTVLVSSLFIAILYSKNLFIFRY